MQLAPAQVTRFYQIWFSLLRFANTKRRVVDQSLLLGESLNPNDAGLVRDVLWSDDQLLQDYIRENPSKLSDTDLAVVQSWRWRVSGSFLVVKHLKKYSVMISNESTHSTNSKVYGVVGLNTPFGEMLYDLPCMINTTLVPFEGKITFDSLFTMYPVQFGRNIAGTLNRDYQNAKKNGAVIESLDRANLVLLR